MQLKSSLVNPHLIVIKRKNCRLKEIERTTMVIKASAITCIVSTFKWKTVDSELLKMRITFLSSSLFESHPITLIFNFITATVSLNWMHKKTTPEWVWFQVASRRPILAGSDPPTTFGAIELNFCVRYGNRCDLNAIITTRYLIEK